MVFVILPCHSVNQVIHKSTRKFIGVDDNKKTPMLKDIETVLFLYLSLFDACDIYIYIY